MVIEFLGPSGGGKTFIAQQLKKYLQDNLNITNQIILTKEDLNDYQKYNNLKTARYLSRIPYIMKLYVDINFISLLLRRMQSRKLKTKASIKYILGLFIQYFKIVDFLKNNREYNPIFIIDEGLLTSSGYMFNNKENYTIEERIKVMNKINAIKSIGYRKQKKIYVLVRCNDFDEILKRINKRKTGSIYSRLSLEEGKKFHNKVINSFEVVIKYLNENNEDYVVIDNSTKTSNYLEQFIIIKEMLETYID